MSSIAEIIIETKWCNDEPKFCAQSFDHKKDYMITETQIVPCGTKEGFYVVATYRYQYPGYTADLATEHAIVFDSNS